ncbi:phage tail tape measure protein [Klebsiella pneumoniae]|uniref:phage tail tape measure protein n=1 Tax=Klebsiella pneumoniae TaxID=573 RepID=UPI0007CD236B|nr:phage tail tape measure protein [Klebsiella pneumoniae]SAW27363.1 Phage-related minor tail protein [Klebsiella pneumoniae]HBR3277488.1 phage tail tape measure protein [Klebsiella pneumoniae]HBW4998899.1 phage tail tape measure protein [Klebsiella pneumoniae]HBW5335474.1 phage tail tape measure protein [Klebsiella pneumoniae]HBW5633498.1 phage tail tape measure protein [Klebsiella pneumoniae]
MANRLTTEILINLAGNLTAKARQYGANMSEFARTNQRAMSVVKATTAAAGRGLDALGNRYTTMIAGFAGGAMVRNYQQLDRRLTRMGITAGKTREEIAGIFDIAQDVAIKFGVDTSEIQGAFEEINARSGDLDLALKNTENIGMALSASGAEGQTLGGLIAEYKKLQIEDKKQTLLALDGMNRLGKEGAFELKDAAEKLPASLSMYAAVGGKGVKGAMDVMTVAESAMDVTANKDKAATAVENFIRDLQNPKVVKTLQRNGINVFDSNGAMRPLPVLLQETAARSSKGGIKKQRGRLTEAGFNQDSMDLIAGASGEAGSQKLKTYMNVVADGQSIIEDAAYASKDFMSATQRLSTAWEKFTNRELAGPVQELADALNSVDKETVNNWLEVGKQITIAVGGLIAARKAFQLGKGALDLFGVGKSKGIPKGVSDVFGSGVMPVYVVNMGSGGMGGGPDVGGPGGRKPPGRGVPGRAYSAMGSAWMVGPLAATIPFLDEKPNLTDDDKASMVKWAQDRAKEPSVWSRVMDWLQPPDGYQDPSPWASMQPQNQPGYPFLQQPELKGSIEVSVKDDRVQVTRVKVNAPGVTMSAQSGVSNVEQD